MERQEEEQRGDNGKKAHPVTMPLDGCQTARDKGKPGAAQRFQKAQSSGHRFWSPHHKHTSAALPEAEKWQVSRPLGPVLASADHSEGL